MKIAQMQVDYVDHMGTDLTVVNAARVSFDKESEWDVGPVEIRPDPGDPEASVWAMPKTLKEADAKLISYLAKHNHWSPFAHTSVQLRVKAPIFVARQLVKHQVGGVWNEVSRRYVDSEPEFFFPETWRGKPINAKQGSDGVITHGDEAQGYAEDVVALALEKYRLMLDLGVAPEQARMALPQNMMTEWYWTGSLVFWARVCKLRLDPHAQAETSEIAHGINRVVEGLFPVAWKELMA